MAGYYQDELNCAIDAVRQSAEICQHVQRQITADVLEKQDQSPVTVADFASQAAICRQLLQRFPGDPIVGEEDADALRRPENAPFLERVREELFRAGIEPQGNDIHDWIDRGNAAGGRERFWTLDPIDGTKGFISGRQYAISLALIVDGEIVVGVLGCPNLPEPGEARFSDDAEDLPDQPAGVIMSAVRNGGAEYVSLKPGDTTRRRVRVSPTDAPAEARFCESVESGHSSHSRSAEIARRLGITRPALRLDSQAKYATVACGDADIYMRLPVRKGYREKIWDHAGGVLVVEEAGGVVTDIDGRPLEFHHGIELTANRGVLVSNGRLYQRLLQAVAATAE